MTQGDAGFPRVLAPGCHSQSLSTDSFRPLLFASAVFRGPCVACRATPTLAPQLGRLVFWAGVSGMHAQSSRFAGSGRSRSFSCEYWDPREGRREGPRRRWGAVLTARQIRGALAAARPAKHHGHCHWTGGVWRGPDIMGASNAGTCAWLQRLSFFKERERGKHNDETELQNIS